MTHNTTCKRCSYVWKPTLRVLSIIPHEADKPENGVRNIRADYCPICETENIAGDLAELDERIAMGKCPGPLLWRKV